MIYGLNRWRNVKWRIPEARFKCMKIGTKMNFLRFAPGVPDRLRFVLTGSLETIHDSAIHRWRDTVFISLRKHCGNYDACIKAARNIVVQNEEYSWSNFHELRLLSYGSGGPQKRGRTFRNGRIIFAWPISNLGSTLYHGRIIVSQIRVWTIYRTSQIKYYKLYAPKLLKVSTWIFYIK